MTNLALIRPRRRDFRTFRTCDWLDGFPLLGRPGAGGVRPGSANTGRGSLAVAAVDVGAAEGAHLVSVVGAAAGQTFLSVTDPDGRVTARGVVGLPLYAGGITFTLAPLDGQPGPAVGDTWALAVLPQPIDLTGLRFDLLATAGTRSVTIALQASTAPTDGSQPGMLPGGAAGTLAMRLLQPAMARCPPGDYPYGVTATDPAMGRTVPAFFGTIFHRATLSLQD